MVFVVVLAVFGLTAALWFGLQGPPYVPTDDTSAERMLKLAKAYAPRRVLDMGSGDGRLVIALARQGYLVDGIELNPWLVVRSRRAIKKAGVQDQARVVWGSFWQYDVSKYDLVTLYVIKHIMPRLEKKLRAELPPGAYVISNYFVFPNLHPVKRIERIVAYRV